jgi:hypothetical protein
VSYVILILPQSFMTTLTLFLLVVQGPLKINFGNRDDVILISQTSGDISLMTGAGTHSVTIDDMVGDIDMNTGVGGSHTMNVNNTRGDLYQHW